MLKQLFAGEYSVAATFWGGFVGFNLAARTLFVFLNVAAFQAYSDENEALIDFLLAAVIIGCAIYCLFLSRGMYISMYRGRAPSAWSWIGLVLIGFGAAKYAYVAVQIYRPDLPVSATDIRQEIRSVSLALPKEVEPGITLTNISFEDGLYQIFYTAEGDDLYDGEYEVILEPGGAEICAEFEGYFSGAVERLEFIYQGDTIRSVGVMDKDTCLAYLADE